MSEIWFTSDLHFGHRNIIEYCNRPWTFEEQDEELVKRWNSRVGLFDEVYHLGDFTFAGRKKAKAIIELIKGLNGKITFIKGNHCQDGLWEEIEKANLAHVMEVCRYKEITVDRTKIVMCHYPLAQWNQAHHGSFMLHGHTHGSYQGAGKILDCGIDNHPDFQVWSYSEVCEYMKDRQYVQVSHHKEGQL